mmetsp:Transcript_46089/g.114611  ORF Transcript_46089/g.114611 Transcript_46089/m.114611 type:complete len:86 (-) Transcript_46089:85-342(-)
MSAQTHDSNHIESAQVVTYISNVNHHCAHHTDESEPLRRWKKGERHPPKTNSEVRLWRRPPESLARNCSKNDFAITCTDATITYV